METGEIVAVKILENLRSQRIETDILKALEKHCEKFFVPMIDHGSTPDGKYFIAMQKLGPSLSDLIKKRKKPFTTKTGLQIAIKITESLRLMHSQGWVHLDRKPSNILIGNGKSQDLHLIDFGICQVYRKNGVHISNHQTKHFIGSFHFASPNIFKRQSLSRRDDMLSLLFLTVYLLNGELPWEANTKGLHQEAVEEHIAHFHDYMNSDQLCVQKA